VGEELYACCYEKYLKHEETVASINLDCGAKCAAMVCHSLNPVDISRDVIIDQIDECLGSVLPGVNGCRAMCCVYNHAKDHVENMITQKNEQIAKNTEE
jgi:hypothetical protein